MFNASKVIHGLLELLNKCNAQNVYPFERVSTMAPAILKRNMAFLPFLSALFKHMSGMSVITSIPSMVSVGPIMKINDVTVRKLLI